MVACAAVKAIVFCYEKIWVCFSLCILFPCSAKVSRTVGYPISSVILQMIQTRILICDDDDKIQLMVDDA